MLGSKSAARARGGIGESLRTSKAMADYLLDSDLLIWHLRGTRTAVERVVELSGRGRLGLSAIVRAEVLQGMRESESDATYRLLDACETFPVDEAVADRAAELVRTYRSRGVTLHLPDALIAATALEAKLPLYTCNARHYPMPGLDLREVRVE